MTDATATGTARAIVDELVRGGVDDVVLCPGSRSAPLAFALLAAERAGALRIHVRVDERSAGFLALGLVRGSGRPVAVAVTSGTAVANLHPAVIEAAHLRLPLLVLSANRPPELRGVGASQTIDQEHVFGAHAAYVDVGADAADRLVRGRVRRALAVSGLGPVQIDVPLREPLVPPAGDAPMPSSSGSPVPAAPVSVAPASAVSPDPVPAWSTEPLDTLVVAAHGAVAPSWTAGLPTVAEPGAPVPGPAVHPLAVPHLRPRRVVVLGRPTLHRPVLRLLADPDVAVHVLTDPRDLAAGTWADIAGNARTVQPWGTAGAADTVGSWGAGGFRSAAGPGPAAPSSAWLEGCAAADARARCGVAAVLGRPGPATGLHVAVATAAATRPGDLLVVGSSNPVRDIALAPDAPSAARVLSPRGAAGIDGAVSLAVGAALAHPGRTLALLGDLTFLHDAGGLLIGPREPRPANLTVVVANDDGGGIFGLLEQGAPEYADDFERLFGTPTGTDLAALCGAHGVPHTRVAVADLAAALGEPVAGLRVVEVPTERAGLRTLHTELRAAAAPGPGEVP